MAAARKFRAVNALAGTAPVFRAVAATVVPEAAALDAGGWAEIDATVQRALAGRPPALRRQLRLLLRMVQWLPVARFGRRFTALDPDRRTQVLAALQDAPVLLLRRGVWGLRTLALMGYYARPQAAAAIGYRADPRGWGARR
jgi:hypothetical protein